MAGSDNKSTMRVGVVGLGPVGTILAAHLIEAGAFVVLCDVDRKRIDAMKSGGIRLEQTTELEVAVADVCYSVAEMKGLDLDLIAVAVKTPTLEKIVPLLAEVVTDKTFVMCVQNGLDNELEIAKVLGEEKTLRMSINYAGGMPAPNVVKVT
ncbi:MAG: hypothetical protein JSW34_13910, partial [Candidatus Zixiibacteriota bacterium]